MGTKQTTASRKKPEATPRPPFEVGQPNNSGTVEVVTLTEPLEEQAQEVSCIKPTCKVPTAGRKISGLEQLSLLRDSLVLRQKQRVSAVASSVASPVRPFVSVTSLSPEQSSWTSNRHDVDLENKQTKQNRIHYTGRSISFQRSHTQLLEQIKGFTVTGFTWETVPLFQTPDPEESTLSAMTSQR
jgi:hypothetical protein